MRIAMLGHKRVPSREGGIEVVVGELSIRMVKHGHHVTCYNRSGHHISGEKYDKKIRKTYKGIKLKSVLTINHKGLAAMTSSISGTICAAFGKYDIVHFHAEGPCAMIWLTKLLGKRCVATIHGLDHKCSKWGKFARAYIMLGERMAVKYADEVIVLSEGIQKYFMDTYGRRPLIIPNGINPPVIRKANIIKRRFKLLENDYILYLGRLVQGKGLEFLISAFKQVKTNKKLVIAGGSSDSEKFVKKLRRMAKDDKRICFTGFVQGQTLAELYSNAFIYVLPSESEGMPISLLEAMSYSNCCVVSDIPECVDVVEDKAIIFRSGDVNELMQKLQKYCNDPRLAEAYKQNAAEFICKKYNWNTVVKNTLDLYETLRKRM
jgi:glycosyltransferase involved in cell wall biosynthesis